MATLTNYIKLVDGVSGPLKVMANGAVAATNAIGRVGPTLERIGNSTSGVNRASNALKELGETAQAALNMVPGMALGTMIGNKLADIVDTVAGLPGELVGVAGEYAGVQARLKLITDTQAEVDEMNKRIYQSALRSRGSYEGMAEAVTKIAMTAKEAFPQAGEVVPFVEGIQKLFVIGGTDKESQKNAMLQLTQALGSGKLQGDEFRSIAEAAPLIEKMVAKHMGVTQGELKELSSKGAITAEIIKDAILSNMNEINEQFNQMPMTFDNAMQQLETVAHNAFIPVFKVINELIGGEGFKEFMNMVSNALPIIANEVQYVVEGIINNVKWVFGILSSHAELIKTVLVGVIGLLAAVGIKALINYGIAAAGAIAHAIASGIETASILALILAQEGLNAAIYACPLTWLIGLVVLMAVAFFAAIEAINYFTGANLSAVGLICGAFMFLATIVANIIKWVINRFINLANFLGGVFENPLKAIYNLFVDIWNGVMDVVEGAVGFIIDMIKQIPGLEDAKLYLRRGRFDMKKKYMEYNPMQELEYGDAVFNANQAYDWGSDILGKLKGPSEIESDPISKEVNSPDIKTNTKKGAKHAKRAADSLDLLEEEVKDMKDYATQEQINKYTNARVTIEVGGISNNISNDVDVDGVIGKLTEALQDSMASSAEAVYSY